MESHGDRFDVLLAVDWQNAHRFAAEIPIDADSLIIGDPGEGAIPEAFAAAGARVVPIPLKAIAKKILGGRPNMVALGVLGALAGLDIAVLGCPAEKFPECYKRLSEIFGGYNLDMVRLEDADALFRHEVMNDGVLLYGSPDLFFEYRAFAYRDFVDSADLFALEEALFRKKMDRIKGQIHGSP